MQTRICKNCQLEKPLRMFVRFGSIVERCRACRAVAQPYLRFWKKLSPEIRERNRMANRARKLKVSVIIPFTKREIVNRDGLNCYLCDVELTFESATIDHVIPLSRGGWHCPSNARIACLKCNQRKSKKLISEYQDEGNHRL